MKLSVIPQLTRLLKLDGIGVCMDIDASRHRTSVSCSGSLADYAAPSKRLAGDLLITQGVPTADGSGRAGLARKVYAALHSTRLHAGSWQAAVRAMNSSFSWTGDLGTEASFCLFRRHLPSIIGDWSIEEFRRQSVARLVQLHSRSACCA